MCNKLRFQTDPKLLKEQLEAIQRMRKRGELGPDELPWNTRLKDTVEINPGLSDSAVRDRRKMKHHDIIDLLCWQHRNQTYGPRCVECMREEERLVMQSLADALTSLLKRGCSEAYYDQKRMEASAALLAVGPFLEKK